MTKKISTKSATTKSATTKSATTKPLALEAANRISKQFTARMATQPTKPRVITSVALPTPEAIAAAYAPVAARPKHKDVSTGTVSIKAGKKWVSDVKAAQQIDSNSELITVFQTDCGCGHDASYHKGTTGKCAACNTCKKFVIHAQKETTIPQPSDEPRGRAKKMMALSAAVSAAKRHGLPKEPPVTALTKVLGRAGFQFIRAEVGPDGAVAYGYAHPDGRAALCTAHQDDVVSPEAVVAKLETGQTIQVTAAQPDAAKSLWEVLRPVSKKQQRIRQARYDGERGAAELKAGIMAPSVDDTDADGLLRYMTNKETPEQALMVVRKVQEQAAKDTAAVMAEPVNGVPAHVVRAVEMLGMITGQKFNVTDLRGDKNYSHRMALLKKLFNRDRVLVEEIGVNNLTQAFYSAVGVGEGTHAAQAVEFTTRCKDLTTTSRMIKRAVVKATKKVVKAVRRVHMPALVVPGRVLEISKPLNRKRRMDKDAADLTHLREEVSNGRQLAQPHPTLHSIVVTNARDLRVLNHKNGTTSLKLERCNSQGAVQVWDNGTKLVTSVLTPALVKDVNPQAWDANMIATMVDTLLTSKSERTQDVEDNLQAAKVAIQCYTEPARLVPTALPIPAPRPAAEDVVVKAGNVKLLEDPLAGLIFVQLEKSNSQGAAVVYNNTSAITTGICPPEWLSRFRVITAGGCDKSKSAGHAFNDDDLARAVNQLLNPDKPSVAVTPTAARHLTAVLDNIKEKREMAINANAISAGRKFVATAAATKTTKPVATKVAATKKTERAPRAGSMAGKASKVLNKEHGAKKGSKRQIGMDIILKSKTVDAALPLLKKAGCNGSFIKFAVDTKLVELV